MNDITRTDAVEIKKPIIIAEIGNNHEGNMDTAIELLESAINAGADLVKFQAGTGEGFARKPEQIPFYKKLELKYHDYIELMIFGEKLGIPVFFSIWSPEMEGIREVEKWHKIPARQCNTENINKYDSENTFISLPPDVKPVLASLNIKSIFMHVIPEYPAYNPWLERLNYLHMLFGQRIGYSDHTIGISTCITAVKDFRAMAIEKHFTLERLKKSSSFRDHIHSASEVEFKKMVEILKG